MNLLLTTPPLDVFEHMALDETMVRLRAEQSTLRFYNWKPGGAVTFGYAQFISEVYHEVANKNFAGEMCRRPTGGGVVYHEGDLTFSLIFKYAEKPSEIYKQLHKSIEAALVLSGMQTHVFTQKLPARAYAPSQHHTANACFVNPVENDLLLPNGQKMLGGAIRRFGTTVLYQGSLQAPGARENPVYKQAVIAGVRGFLNTDLHARRAEDAWLEQARNLAVSQYKTLMWTEKF